MENMHNTQEEQQRHQHWKRSAIKASVMQQRGNVIVSRSEVISQPNDFDNEKSDLFSKHKDGERSERTDADVSEVEFPVEDSSKDFVTLQPVTFDEYPAYQYPHRVHDGCQNPSRSTADVQNAEVFTTVQLEKTDQNIGTNDKNSMTETEGTTSEGSKSLVCQYCQKAFKHKSYFNYHMRTHTGERPFQCELCKKSFFERSKLNRHLSTCHNINDSPTDEQSDVTSRTCPQCNKTFSRITGLQIHILTHHEGGRPYSCTKCNKKFSGMTALKNHEIWHEGKKNLCCDICGKAFLLKKYLDLHLKSTHKQEKKKHFCTSCNKGFLFEKDLRRHQVSHYSGKNFSCSFCETSFKRKDNLHRHFKLTHLLTQEQIDEVSGNSVVVIREVAEAAQLEANNSADVVHKATAAAKPENVPVAPLPINQVSVIKSTHEVIMSITRGQPYM